MHWFFRTCVDTLFPLSAESALVRDTPHSILATLAHPKQHNDTTVLFSYHTPLVRTFIHEAKFHRNRDAIQSLGQSVKTYLCSLPHKSAYLIPIPLSHTRFRQRGYNQVEEIAAVACVDMKHIQLNTTLLTKIRHTPSQTSLSRTDRLVNLTDAFSVELHAIPTDTPLILFDDILTTGATLTEATRTLRQAGFTTIERLVLAH